MLRILTNIGYFLLAKWRIVLPIIFVIVLAFYLKSCWSAHKAKLNEKQIIAAQQAIAKQDREEIKQVLAESDADVAVLDSGVADAEAVKQATIAESKKKYDAMTAEELQAEAKRRVEESQ